MPTLADLARDPSTLDGLPAEAIPALVGEAASLHARLLARLMASGQDGKPDSPERLLSVDEAARMLQVSKSWLYKRTARLPFVVKVGSRVCYSEAGIRAWIRRRMGR